MKKYFFLIYCISISLVAILLLEIAVRYTWFKFDSFSYTKMKSNNWLGDSGLIQSSEHLDIIYELKPNLNTYFRLNQFITNSNGLRDKEYSITKPENTYRVAVLGDSFTMASGIDIEDSYHSILERRFNRGNNIYNYEFINFGVGGYNLKQYLSVLNKKAMEYEPDLVLIGLDPHNDHIIPDAKIFEEPYIVKRTKNPLYHIYIKDAASLAFANIQNKIFGQSVSISETIITQVQEKYINDVFSNFKEITNNTNSKLAIINLTYLPNQDYSDKLKELALTNNLLYFDASQSFESINVNKLILYPNDFHPNAFSNRIFAQQLYNFLIPILINQE